MKLASKIATVLGGFLLQATPTMASIETLPLKGAVEVGQLPGGMLIQKVDCNEPSFVNHCFLPNSSDVKEEIRVFLANADRRQDVVQSRLPLLAEAASRIRDSAGTNPSLPSYAFYAKAAEQVASIATNKRTLADIAFFDRKNSPVLVELRQLLKVLVNFEAKIARAKNPGIREGLIIGRNESVLKALTPIYDLHTYANHLSWRYFESKMRILTTSSYACIDDPRRFDLSSSINIVNLCCDGNTGLSTIAITKAAQAGQFDSLTLLEDQATIKGILDAPVTLTFESKKVYRTPKLRYDKASNTITREYKRRGSPFIKNGDEIWSTQSLVQFLRDIYQN